jgi:hypothetical protein
MVLAVSEDWGGAGAGNGLEPVRPKVARVGSEKYGVDLTACLAEGLGGLLSYGGKGDAHGTCRRRRITTSPVWYVTPVIVILLFTCIPLCDCCILHRESLCLSIVLYLL